MELCDNNEGIHFFVRSFGDAFFCFGGKHVMTDYKESYLKLINDLSKEIDNLTKIRNNALDVYIKDAMSSKKDNDIDYEYVTKQKSISHK